MRRNQTGINPVIKRIGFITTNKVLAQSLVTLIKNYPDLEFDPFTLSNLDQAVLDAEVLNIDVAVVEIVLGTAPEVDAISRICDGLHKAVPHCRILLLVPPGSDTGRGMAMEATRTKTIDDYVFCDASLDYLLAKLLYI